jgi:hypothetical protein
MELRISLMIQFSIPKPNTKPIGTIKTGHRLLMIWNAISIKELKSRDSEVESNPRNIFSHLLS